MCFQQNENKEHAKTVKSIVKCGYKSTKLGSCLQLNQNMNSNFYWQSPCYQFYPENPNPFYLNSVFPPVNIQQTNEPSYDQLLSKCQQLEIENSKLKEELALHERAHVKKHKRIVKRRKEEELQKIYKCPHLKCKKQYASSLALNLHIKNKHFQEFLTKKHQNINQSINYQHPNKNENQFSSTE